MVAQLFKNQHPKTNQHKKASILRRMQVQARVGLSRSTIYDRIQAGTFPSPIRLGGARAVGWIEDEVDEWLATQIHKCRKA